MAKPIRRPCPYVRRPDPDYEEFCKRVRPIDEMLMKAEYRVVGSWLTHRANLLRDCLPERLWKFIVE